MIHPTAIIHPGARLAENVSVGPFTIIGQHVSIDSGTKVSAHVVIEGWTRIGHDNQIFQFSSIGAAPQDLKYSGQETYLKIGDRNRIREFVTLNYLTGELIEELGSDSDAINLLREEAINSEDFSSYRFPAMYDSKIIGSQKENEILNKLNEKYIITGGIEYVLMDDLLLFNFHSVNPDKSFKNIFRAVDLLDKKNILEVILNSRTNAFAPDSFFVKDDLLFLLIEKIKLEVHQILN